MLNISMQHGGPPPQFACPFTQYFNWWYRVGLGCTRGWPLRSPNLTTWEGMADKG